MNEGKLKDITIEEIQEYIDKNWSYESIGAIYGVSGSAIRKKMKRVGKVLPKRRNVSPNETFNKGVKLTSQNYCINCNISVQNGYKYCSNKCEQEYKRKERISDWKEHPEKYSKEELPEFIRQYLIDKYNGCQICGWNEINPTTGKTPLEVHHIDGDCTNNAEENLQLLCPNHHSLTPNSGALNKGNSKRYKYKAYRKEIANLTENETVKVWE